MFSERKEYVYAYYIVLYILFLINLTTKNIMADVYHNYYIYQYYTRYGKTVCSIVWAPLYIVGN